MKNDFLKKILLVLIAGLISISPIFDFNVQAVGLTTSVTVSVCGNNAIEGTETCDRTALGGQTCLGLGYGSGTLSCQADCASFDVSQCSEAPSPTSPPAGGTRATPPTAYIILQGKAYPEATVTILKDGQFFLNRKADASGDFKIGIADLSAGIYNFSLWAKDRQERKSETFSVSVTASEGMTTTISGIFLSPTIELEKNNLKTGEVLKVSGQSAPQSELTLVISNSSGQEIIKKTKAQINGDWSFSLNTSDLKEDSYAIKAKAETQDGLISPFSRIADFYIGKMPPGWIPEVPLEVPTEEVVCGISDLNCDGKVNLVDFSILLYWWGKDNPKIDADKDGMVDLVDFSIMMYYWTG